MNRVFSKDGTAIAFDRQGQGPPVVLVDGALCSRAFGPMPRLAPLLARHFTVFHYDRRGRNDSGDTAPYAVEREIEDLGALIDEAGGSAFVYGVSSGAALALMAAGCGLAIERLALYEPPFMVDQNGRRPPDDHQAQLRQLVVSGRRSDALKFFMTRVVGMPSLFVWPMRLMPMWPRLEAVAHTLPYDAAVMGDYSLPAARAASVRAPTLAIAGEKSPLLLQKAARAVAEVVPGARHRSLKGQTHNASAKALAPVLVEHFSAAGAGSRDASRRTSP